MVKPLAGSQTLRIPSPQVPAFKTLQHSNFSACLLPQSFSLSIRLPWGRYVRKISGDVRKTGENIILWSSLLWGLTEIRRASQVSDWTTIELACLLIASIIYLLWTHLSYFSLPKTLNPPQSPRTKTRHRRSSSPKTSLPVTPVARKDDFGYIWMTVPKNYRNSTDDGVFTGLLLGPIIATACLRTSTRSAMELSSDKVPLPPSWYIEPPAILDKSVLRVSALEALVRSRIVLVQLATFCSFLFLTHLVSSRLYEARCRARLCTPEGERASVPRSEWRRSRLYILFSLLVSASSVTLRYVLSTTGIGVWKDLSYLDTAVISMFYQVTLYLAIRLAHHSFTLGELGFAVFGACILFHEAMHLTIARIWPITTPFIRTYRLPSPLLIFQLALIPGSILIGFLLSPLLYLSRHIAQRPLRKLRFPEQKQVHRKFLAAGFYFGAALITGGLIGLWTKWCLGGRDPWLWVIFWIVEGRTQWTRPLLLTYWATLAIISVAGWSRQLSRSRKYRLKTSLQPVVETPQTGTAVEPPTSSEQVTPAQSHLSNSLGLSLPALPTLPNSANVSAVANELLDAADKRMPTLTLNARRKFFHALAVIMFVPGIAFDPAFTHLAFSAAFAAFTFAEYMRYFALYPFGAAIHVFLSEFLDNKDNGTAILSHFYLLTGCAGSVWLEGPSRLLGYTGVLVLGVGDAMASIVGRRIGRHRWSPASPKTVEGSVAFVFSVVVCAWLLRACGLVEPFSSSRYACIVSVTAVLEALSVQNDNLTLPWYMWSMLILNDP